MIYCGDIELKKMFFFDNELQKVYFDNKLVYEKENGNSVIGEKKDSRWRWFIPPFTQQNVNANVEAIDLGRRLGGQNFKRVAKIDGIEVNIPFPTSWIVIYPMTGMRYEEHGTTYWVDFTIEIKNNDVLEYCFFAPNLNNLNKEQLVYEYTSRINNKQLAEKLNKDSQLNKPISINFE